MQHPRQKPGARNKNGTSLGSVVPEFSSAPLTSKPRPQDLSTAAIEKPRGQYPLYWRPDRSAPGLAIIGSGGAS